MPDRAQDRFSPLVHATAMVLTIAVFPLIWVGGLVTTYDAGMAVPDWPGTYGYNLFLYPATTWLLGPFDLMVEHSHRLLGALAGLLSIGLVIMAWRYDSRPWFRWWTVGVLLTVIAQGILGGMRVRLDARTLAMIHGCTGPLFFAIASATAVMSSRFWTSGAGLNLSSGWTANLATTLVGASYAQLIVGAQMRHVTSSASHRLFTGFVHVHLTLAVLVAILSLVVMLNSNLTSATPRKVCRPALLLLGLVMIQIGLGVGTWMVNYALPWSELTEQLARYTIQAKGFWESMIVTAHMATGSLIISVSTVIALRAWRTRAVGNAFGEGMGQWKRQTV